MVIQRELSWGGDDEGAQRRLDVDRLRGRDIVGALRSFARGMDGHVAGGGSWAADVKVP